MLSIASASPLSSRLSRASASTATRKITRRMAARRERSARSPPARRTAPGTRRTQRYGPLPTGACTKGALARLAGRKIREQVRRERRDVKDRVVELFGIGVRKPEDDTALALGGDRGDVAQLPGQPRRDRGVARAPEGEHHVLRGDRHAVLPGRPGIEVEHQGHRVAPAPALGQRGHERTVTRRDERGPELRQPEKELVGDVEVAGLRLRTLHQRRDRQRGLAAGDDDDARLGGDGSRGPGRECRDEARAERGSERPARHTSSGVDDRGGGASNLAGAGSGVSRSRSRPRSTRRTETGPPGPAPGRAPRR